MARFTTRGPKGDAGTGSTDTYAKIILTNNGTTDNIKIGDDVYLGDGNVANSVVIKGQQTATNAGVVLGSGKTEKVSTDGSNLSLNANNDIILNPGSTYAYIGTPLQNGNNRIAVKSDLQNNGSWTTNFTDSTGTLAGITATGNYNRIGNMVFFCVNVSFNGYTNLGTGQYQFDLPFAPKQTFTSRGGTLHNPNTDSKYHIAAIVDIISDGANAKAKLYYTGSTTDLAWKYSTPVNWAHNTTHFDMSGFYEIAQS
jgi:hypothetical protein